MPQMKPMNWMFSLILFSMILFLFMMMNYFNIINKSNSTSLNTNLISKKLNWKW